MILKDEYKSELLTATDSDILGIIEDIKANDKRLEINISSFKQNIRNQRQIVGHFAYAKAISKYFGIVPDSIYVPYQSPTYLHE